MTVSPHIPEAAWTRRLDAVLESPGKPGSPSLDQIIGMLPAILRIRRATRKALRQGVPAVMNPFRRLNPGPYMGVPLGGLGGGTITRGWQGDFSRWQLQPGVTEYRTVPADQFSVYIRRAGDERPILQTLYPGRPTGGALAGWAWDMPGECAAYHALYPRAWTVYEGLAPQLRLVCRQVSPVIPHNYRESSFPAGVFAWTIENTGDRAVTVGIMLTFQNGTGGESDRAGGHANRGFAEDSLAGPVRGVALRHHYRQPGPRSTGEEGDHEDPLTFAIAALGGEGVEVTTRARFITTGSGMDVWGDFASDGRLDNAEDPRPSTANMAIGAAVCATVEVPPGAMVEIPFALAWDMPLARFGGGRAWNRRYTRFYGRSGNAATHIAADALAGCPDWEMLIDAWQDPILEDERLPSWFRAALLNETYYLADGGTVWTDGEEGEEAPDDDIGQFAYLEGHEYLMYNTYDVHFYASFALAQLWPELELSLQRDVARAIEMEHSEVLPMLLSGQKAPRKVRGAVPHDLGKPSEDPWHRVNAYDYQDASRWKDLNSKFVLQVYRDFVATSDIEFVAQLWDQVVGALEYLKQFDMDEDGLIENEGFPDQTYDAWAVKGPSAYSGGLWLAALAAAAQMADLLDRPEEAAQYRETLRRGQKAYEELLWTGEYYAYDASGSRQSNSIMADQLAGDWYARACGLEGVAPEDNARRALKKVFDYNVKSFAGGQMGAVNGMRPDGRVDTTSMQSQEVWTGTSYAVAAAMLQLGMQEEAFATAEGVVAQTYEKLGYWFATPEAWTLDGSFRSLAYMRPLCIWAIYWAWSRGEGLEF